MPLQSNSRRRIPPYSTPLRAACVEWLLPVPATAALFSVVGAATFAFDGAFFLSMGMGGAILCAPFAVLGAVVLVTTETRRSAELAYVIGILLATGAMSALIFFGFGSHEGLDELYSGIALGLSLFGPIILIFGAVFRRMALRRAEAAAAQRMKQAGFQPTEICANCSHPLLSDSSRCAECGAPNTR